MNYDIETFIISYFPLFVFPISAIPFLIVAKIFKDKSQKWQWQANIYVQKHEYNKAVECAMQEKDGNSKFFHLADAYIGLNDLNKAQEYLENISDDSTRAYFRRKLLILEKKGNIQQAKEEYEKSGYSKNKTYDEFLFTYRESFQNNSIN